MRQGQEEAATKALKRAKFEKPYTYRRKGNEEQAVFNSRLDETVAEAETELAVVSPGAPTPTTAISKARECLKKGRQLLAERQKLIRIADRSELGWGVVAEYTADELADDSGDEKRLEKAERAAEHKASKRKRKRGTTSMGGRPRAGRNPQGQVSSAPAGTPPFHQPTTALSRRPIMAGLPPAARVAGPCFACGEMGHIRIHCHKMTALGAEGTRKWYPFEGGGEGSVLEGVRMEIVGGRVCTDAELYGRDGVGSGSTTEAVGHSLPEEDLQVSLSPLFKEELGVTTTLTHLIRNTCGDVGSPLAITDTVVWLYPMRSLR